MTISTNSTRHNISIIGGGIAGLTAAYDLARSGQQVSVYEGASFLGGLASGFKGEGWDWPLERFYHHIFTSDTDIINLAKEIGFGDKVFFKRPITAMWYHGKPYAFDSPLRVLAFPHLNPLAKIRMSAVLGLLRYTHFWRTWEKTTSDAWLSQWMGAEAYEMLWKPMLEGKFGAHYRDVNLAWFWARIYKRSPALGYFEGGFQAFVDTLAAQVRKLGVEILLNTQVQKIQAQAEGGVRLQTSVGERMADAVIATVPPSLMSKIAPDLPPSYLQGLNSLQSMGAVVMTVALDRRVTDDLYWINIPKAEGFPFLSFVEHTNFIDPVHYGGQHLIYLGDYLDPDHRYFQMTKEELLATFLPAMKRFNPAFDPSWLVGSYLNRTTYAQPIPPVNYSHQIPPLRTPLAGVYFASMSQVYPWDRGTNYAVQIGRQVAELVGQGMQSGHVKPSQAVEYA